MERRNIEGFENAFPGNKFPEFRTLTDEEMQKIRCVLIERLGLNADVSRLQIVKSLAGTAEICSEYDADSEAFGLRQCLSRLGIVSQQNVLVNFYRFDDIDELRLVDIDKYFKYIWYPRSDDIDIFDGTLSWILSVSHDGEISVRRF